MTPIPSPRQLGSVKIAGTVIRGRVIVADLGAGIALAALFLSVAYCTVQQGAQSNEEKRICLDHGGYTDSWSGACKIKGRNA